MKQLLKLIQKKGSVILNKLILGNTKTELLDKTSREIAFNKSLSVQIYEKIDTNDDFIITSESGKRYKIKLLKPKDNVWT